MRPLPFDLHHRPTIACALFTAAFVVAGCSECDENASRCQGTVAQRCEWHGDGPLSTRQWDSTGCKVACVMAEGHAQCVDSPAPIAECAGGDGPTCYQGSTTYCVGGYPTSTQACDQGLHCVPSATCGTVCASADAPDARCGTAPSSFFCDGDATLTACTCGFPGPSYACAPGVCHEMAGDSFCVASTTPDPRCGDPAKPMGGFCDGQIARECWYGLLTASTDCGTTATCVILGDGSAACQFTPMHG